MRVARCPECGQPVPQIGERLLHIASSQQSARSIRSAAVEFGRGQILDLDRSRSLRSDLFTVPLCPQRRVFPGSRLGMPVITRQSEGMAACAVVTQVGDVRCSAADLLVISKVRQPDAGAASESVGPVEAVEHQVGLFVGEASPCRAGEVGLDLPVDQKAYLGDSTTSILTNTGGTGDEMPRHDHTTATMASTRTRPRRVEAAGAKRTVDSRIHLPGATLRNRWSGGSWSVSTEMST